MKFLSYCTPDDIVRRISKRKKYWFHGKPKIQLLQNNNKFGSLVFDFGDEKISYSILVKDKKAILDAAHIAIDNFKDFF